MSPTQIAELEAEYLRRARDEEEAGDRLNASTWRLAAALLISAASPVPADPCPGHPEIALDFKTPAYCPPRYVHGVCGENPCTCSHEQAPQ